MLPSFFTELGIAIFMLLTDDSPSQTSLGTSRPAPSFSGVTSTPLIFIAPFAMYIWSIANWPSSRRGSAPRSCTAPERTAARGRRAACPSGLKPANDEAVLASVVPTSDVAGSRNCRGSSSGTASGGAMARVAARSPPRSRSSLALICSSSS